MLEGMTFEAIMARCLARVPGNIDKREGSIIYDALAPAAVEIAQAFVQLQSIKDDLAFPDTMKGENLTKKTAERGIFRHPATKALRRVLCYSPAGALMDVPVGTRFSGGSQNYVLVAKSSTGIFTTECETAGMAGNQYFGALIPIDFVQGLGRAVLEDVLVPAEDEESDTALYARYEDSLEGIRFGGNRKDYADWLHGLNGVGGVRVYPVWAGGGSVRLVFITSDWGVPAPELVDTVQTAVDPETNKGRGDGIAPIGHTVTVEGVRPLLCNVVSEITLHSGYNWDQVQESVENTISGYLLELCSEWEQVEAVVVRISQIETRVLQLPEVMDIAETTLNGSAQNLTLGPDEIPQLGTVTPS